MASGEVGGGEVGASEEVGGGNAALAGGLQAEDLDGAVAGGDYEAVAVDGDGAR